MALFTRISLIFHFDEENEFSTILDFEFESKTLHPIESSFSARFANLSRSSLVNDLFV